MCEQEVSQLLLIKRCISKKDPSLAILVPANVPAMYIPASATQNKKKQPHLN